MVQVVAPKIGERIYDGACGSAGFLCESFDFLTSKKSLTTKDLKTLQERTFYGKEKKPLAYVIAIMNMILHGIDAPNIIHTNTLTENLADFVFDGVRAAGSLLEAVEIGKELAADEVAKVIAGFCPVVVNLAVFRFGRGPFVPTVGLVE